MHVLWLNNLTGQLLLCDTKSDPLHLPNGGTDCTPYILALQIVGQPLKLVARLLFTVYTNAAINLEYYSGYAQKL